MTIRTIERLMTATALATALILLGATTCSGQLLRGIVLEPARSKMVVGWDAAILKGPRAPERAYCVNRWAVGPHDLETYAYVIDVVPALPDSAADPNTVHVECMDPTWPVIHTHLPSTCDLRPNGHAKLDTCQQGGVNAYLCSLSWPDRQNLITGQHPFDAVQCDRNSFVFEFHPPRIPPLSNPDTLR